MPKDKVKKLSISMPTSMYEHVLSRKASGGISEFFQMLVSEDIERTKRTALPAVQRSEEAQRGASEMERGIFVNLHPSLIQSIAREAAALLREESDGNDGGNARISEKPRRAKRDV